MAACGTFLCNSMILCRDILVAPERIPERKGSGFLSLPEDTCSFLRVDLTLMGERCAFGRSSTRAQDMCCLEEARATARALVRILQDCSSKLYKNRVSQLSFITAAHPRCFNYDIGGLLSWHLYTTTVHRKLGCMVCIFFCWKTAHPDLFKKR